MAWWKIVLWILTLWIGINLLYVGYKIMIYYRRYCKEIEEAKYYKREE